MTMKGYSAFHKTPALLKPYHQIVYCHIQDTHKRTTNQCDKCASPVVGSHFGRSCCELHSSGHVWLIPGDTSGGRSQGFNPLRRGWVYRLAPGVPLLEKCWQSPGHFWKCRARVGSGPAPEPTLKRPCAILVRLVGWKTNNRTLTPLQRCSRCILVAQPIRPIFYVQAMPEPTAGIILRPIRSYLHIRVVLLYYYVGRIN